MGGCNSCKEQKLLSKNEKVVNVVRNYLRQIHEPTASKNIAQKKNVRASGSGKMRRIGVAETQIVWLTKKTVPPMASKPP